MTCSDIQEKEKERKKIKGDFLDSYSVKEKKKLSIV